MYLFLGNKTVIDTKDLIGVFDMDTASVSKKTRNYLSDAQKKEEVESVVLDLPKSFIVVKEKNYNQKVYLSTGMTATLIKRMQRPNYGGYICE